MHNLEKYKQEIIRKRNAFNCSFQNSSQLKERDLSCNVNRYMKSTHKNQVVAKNNSFESIPNISRQVPQIRITHKQSERDTANLSPIYSNKSGNKNIIDNIQIAMGKNFSRIFP